MARLGVPLTQEFVLGWIWDAQSPRRTYGGGEGTTETQVHGSYSCFDKVPSQTQNKVPKEKTLRRVWGVFI